MKSRFGIIRLVLAVLGMVLLLGGSPPLATRIAVDSIKVTTPVYTPDFDNFDPKLGRYSYTVAWNGIPAGVVELKLHRSKADFKIEADARTAKMIDLLYKLRHHSEAVVSADTLLPKRAVYMTRENSRKKITELNFLPGGTIVSVRRNHHGEVETLEFHPDNLTLDPFSAGFLALSLKWDIGDSRRFDTFNGKSRYLIELVAVDKTSIEVNGRMREAIVIQPHVTKLTDSDPSDKLRGAKIYISTDGSGEILQIVSDLFIGSVKTKLTSFSPGSPDHTANRSALN